MMYIRTFEIMMAVGLMPPEIARGANGVTNAKNAIVPDFFRLLRMAPIKTGGFARERMRSVDMEVEHSAHINARAVLNTTSCVIVKSCTRRVQLTHLRFPIRAR